MEWWPFGFYDMRAIAWRFVAVWTGLLACALAHAGPLRYRQLPVAPVHHELVKLITDPQLAEISGMARSQRRPDLLWAHNDSDNGNWVYALDQRGNLLARMPVAGETNVDWEDLASFTWKRQPYLLIADTGDNGGQRREIRLVVVAEPEAPQADRPLVPAWVIRVRWPDGPRDCEAVAVDPNNLDVLLLSKKRVPAQLFRVPLIVPKGQVQPITAEQVAHVAFIPQPTATELARAAPEARYMSQITAMDTSPDGRLLAVLTYKDAYLFVRGAREPWVSALRRKPWRLNLPPLIQAESIAFDADGRGLWVSSEKIPAPLVHTRFTAPVRNPR